MVLDDYRPVRLELPAAARRLLEVTLQQALQGNTVAGLIAKICQIPYQSSGLPGRFAPHFTQLLRGAPA